MLRELSGLCGDLAERIHAIRHDPPVNSLIQMAHDELLGRTSRDLDERQLADTLGQTILQARVAWTTADPRLHATSGQPGVLPPTDWLIGKLLPMAIGIPGSPYLSDALGRDIESILMAADDLVRSAASMRPVSSLPTELPFHDGFGFDSFFAAHDPRGRSRRGVFFTPPPLASFIVREVDRLLREEFRLAEGLADTSTWSQLLRGDTNGELRQADYDRPFINILDPAAGAGVFLIEVIDQIWTTFRFRQSEKGSEGAEAWNDQVSRHLLPRLRAIDLLLPACATAWVRIAEKLATTGYRFESTVPIGVELGDALAAPEDDSKQPELFDRAPVRRHQPVTVVVGNPPFSALTVSGNAWIDGLLRNPCLNRRQVGGFYEVDGIPLGEKKLWLHDDYVKFLRYAQWQIENAGCGIIGLVTSHGYLDNLTFRGVRRSLLNSFPRISIVDLHGSRKKREKPPDGLTDENLFGIDQGVAVGLFRKPPFESTPKVVRADLWGSRVNKMSALQSRQTPSWHALSPQAPYYLFAPFSTRVIEQDEYCRGFPLDKIMPVNSTAVVTARDSFAVAFTEEELLNRMRVFTDASLSDAELRHRYFSRTRSSRYPSGDTRGWKLETAREQARRRGDLRSLVQRCLYRPFDWRWVLWADWMIDWPRNDVTRHMLAGDNLALVTRRQMIPGQPANYFFVADRIVIDGLIRSDNRGSESFFPLFLQTESGSPQWNFSTEFLQACSRVGHEFAKKPRQLFQMIYAQFHSRAYRERYQSELCFGFPRVFIPASEPLFRVLVEHGRQLIEAHLLRGEFEVPRSISHESSTDSHSLTLPLRDWPQHDGETLWMNEDHSLNGISEAVWEFHVGGYQICKKWLRDRRGRTIHEREANQLRGITASISATIRIMGEIDSVIEKAGGWPVAFVGRAS
jgi:predicted helicase